MLKAQLEKLTRTQKKALVLVPALSLLVALPLVAAWAVEKSQEQEVQGVVEVIPAQRQGLWKIAGREITANAQTEFKEKHCNLKVGALAEAEYKTEGQTLVAEEIKCETEAEIKGSVQQMPTNRIGVWKIAGQTVTANQQTRFDDKECPIKVGSPVEAKVEMTAQGLTLKKLECETEDD